MAAYLDSRLEGSKTPVVVYGHKDPYMLVCFLACVKSGRAYCPVDISVPAERIKDIIEVTKSPVILAVNPLPFNTSDVMDLNKIKDESHTHKTALSKDKYVGSDDIFYIIFTSGSTGKPKGVCITEDCLYNFVNWAVTLTNINPLNKKTVFLNQAPFSFDLSVMDLFLSLYTGGTLFCLDKTTQTNPTALMSALQASNAEVWVSTPSFANLCLAYNVFDSALMPNVDTFLFCGETLTNNTAKSLLERFPKAKVVNTYGPVSYTHLDVYKRQDADDRQIPEDVSEKILRFARCSLAAGQMKNKSYVAIGSVAMGIAGSFLDPMLMQNYFGIRAEWVDMVEILRRIDNEIYDKKEYEKALSWARENCKIDDEDFNACLLYTSRCV